MAEIRFEGVGKEYEARRVVEPFSLTIEDGEFFTFVGPSGCGKSTILSMIAGLQPASEGRLLFDGKVVNDLSPAERDVAMVFQSYALYPHLNVFDNIAFPLRIRKMAAKTIEAEVRRVAELLGLTEKLRNLPKELSGGQRQRVALGRAIVRKPKVFLMDEPLSNLDPRLRMEMRTELKKLHRDLGITTVYVTHEQGEAMSLSDRIALFSAGRIQQCAPPEEMYLRPANMFVASFMGGSPINFIPATLAATAGIVVPRDEDAVAAIRPEDISLSPLPRALSVPVTAGVTEPAGSFAWVEFLWEGHRCRGVAPVTERLEPGATIHALIPQGRVMLFRRGSGEAFDSEDMGKGGTGAA